MIILHAVMFLQLGYITVIGTTVFLKQNNFHDVDTVPAKHLGCNKSYDKTFKILLL